GLYAGAAAAAGRLQVAVDDFFFALPEPLWWTADGQRVYESRDAFAQRLQTAADLGLLLPQAQTRTLTAQGFQIHAGPVSDPASIYQPFSAGASDLLSVVTFDLGGAAAGPVGSVSFVAGRLSGLPQSGYDVLTNQVSFTTQANVVVILPLANGDRYVVVFSDSSNFGGRMTVTLFVPRGVSFGGSGGGN